MQLKKSLFILSVYFLLAFGSAAQAGYIDNLDGTVTDTGTGLMWQQATATGTYTWQQALAYCENLDLAGYTDWRLPTSKELESLTDKRRGYLSITPPYFSDTEADYYWSSTPDAYSAHVAWIVYFGDGYSDSGWKTYYCYVRAVRAGQSGSFADLTLWPVPDTGQTTCYDASGVITCPQPGQAFYGQDANYYSFNIPTYTKLAAGGSALPNTAATWAMVRDEVTGLVWEEKHNKDSVKNYTDPNDADNTYTWYDSNPATNGGDPGTPGDSTDTEDFINALNTSNYGGYSDWCLPTDKELQTIIDYGRYNPSINTNYFPDAVTSDYWSSTASAAYSYSAWRVNFYSGYVSDQIKSGDLYVRAVRGGHLFIAKSGAGTGTVVSNPSGINCGSDCTEVYTKGTQIALTATAGSGSSFTGWSGGGCSGTGQCVVTVTDNVTVTANFDLVPMTTTTIGGTTTTTTVPISTTSIISSTTTSTGGGSTTTTSTGGATTTTTTTSGPCPAKKVLGSDNPKLENLRAFRDSKLAQSAMGRKVIQIYYNNAESINVALDQSPALKAFTRRILEVIAPMVGNN